IRSLDALPNNLPRQLTSFIGREKEIAEVKRLLSTSYLVTLTGSGGAGKTRLALQVAADLVGDYRDGGWVAGIVPHGGPGPRPEDGRLRIERARATWPRDDSNAGRCPPVQSTAASPGQLRAPPGGLRRSGRGLATHVSPSARPGHEPGGARRGGGDPLASSLTVAARRPSSPHGPGPYPV